MQDLASYSQEPLRPHSFTAGHCLEAMDSVLRNTVAVTWTSVDTTCFCSLHSSTRDYLSLLNGRIEGGGMIHFTPIKMGSIETEELQGLMRI